MLLLVSKLMLVPELLVAKVRAVRGIMGIVQSIGAFFGNEKKS